MSAPYPIFIITHDRINCLDKSIESYKSQIDSPFEIVIFDVNSTYEPMLDHLEDLEKSGICVYRHRDDEGDYMNVIIGIRDYYRKNPNANKFFVVTDPDIELDEVNGDILELYRHILKTKKVECVGPMLRIDDIPDHYPLKEKAVEMHTKQFWKKKPKPIKYNGHVFYYQNAPIASTFAMYRPGCSFGKLNMGIRTYSPYAARHLDWYIDLKNMTEDQLFYLENACHNGNWSATLLRNHILKNLDEYSNVNLGKILDSNKKRLSYKKRRSQK